MSRIGKKSILIPENVEVKIVDQKIEVKGPLGELFREVRSELAVEIKEGQIFVNLKVKTKNTKSLWGLTRTLIANMISGVTIGYQKKLEMVGIGYKASVEGDNLVLQVGFTHPVKINAPSGIRFSTEKNVITISGIDKELVGQIAAKIRKTKPPEPYKGKGIRYQGEIIRRKAGKKAATTA